MRRALALLLCAAAAHAEPPQVNYMLHCMGCHLMDGGGMPPEVPRLAGRVGYYLEVPEGRRYLVQVPGAAQSLLDDAALADVLNWILAELGRESVSAGFEPYTGAEVGRYRRRPPEDIDALRWRLARQIGR
jgi:mono/diheme cytochrome c family protein